MLESQYNAGKSGTGPKRIQRELTNTQGMGWSSKPSADTDSVD